jgi:hypothetical protein
MRMRTVLELTEIEPGRVPAVGPAGRQRTISPTDLSRFITLDQCERFLRLRLADRADRGAFLDQLDVRQQSIPPLLTRAGKRFEEAVERAVSAHCQVTNLERLSGQGAGRGPDNAYVLNCARKLAPGAVRCLFQARLHVSLATWEVRGDVDILRLERDAAGVLRVLIADMKSSAKPKVEHRLQVAFYAEMLDALFSTEGIACTEIATGILYQGPRDTSRLSEPELARLATERAEAEHTLGVEIGLLELIADGESYRASVRDLVTGEASIAARVAEADFRALPYCLSAKCDGCLYNEYCLKHTELSDDLSLLPHLTAGDKSALRRAGIRTTRALAALKAPLATAGDESERAPLTLAPAPGQEELAQRLAATWPVGPRVDELVLRARRYRRWRGDALEPPSRLPGKGYGTLPYCDAQQNPNLVRVYIDAQLDYLHDRVYLLGALVVACEGGIERAGGRRAIVRMTPRSPETPELEERLFLDWIGETLRAVAELAAPNEEGEPRAPIHLIFYDQHDQRCLLEGLARHATALLGATALYDFLTQLAAYDSPVVTFLDQEIRELRNYPLLCQSLQSVAGLLKFDWNYPEPYRQRFYTGLFDSQRRLEGEAEPPAEGWPWYTARARFSSNIPLEYAYAAWEELAAPPAKGRDEYAPYRQTTTELLRGFQLRRLEALEHITRDFHGNKQTAKTAFTLPDLGTFTEKADSLAQALEEFITIERHVALGEWKAKRLAAPERRVLSGDTLLVRYSEADQEPAVAAKMSEFIAKRQRREELRAAYRAANPEAKRLTLTKAERAATECSLEGLLVRLSVEVDGTDCALSEALALSTLREGERVICFPRWVYDERLPEAERTPFTPTPKQMLYGMRADLRAIQVRRDAEQRAISATIVVEVSRPSPFTDGHGFVFSGREEPFVDGALYTLDLDPNDWYGYQCKTVVDGLVEGQFNTLHERLAHPATAHATWPEEAREGQRRFLEGLEALREAGALHGFEESKLDYIGGHGEAPLLLVQGPPGTGKSYTTGIAVFARLQGALAAGMDFRVILACKTHAATDVLLENVAKTRQKLRDLAATQPSIFRRYFDPRLIEEVTLFRVEPPGKVPDGVVALPRERDREGLPHAAERLLARSYCVVAAPPGKVYRILRDRWDKHFFGHELFHCLVLDEASQMSLPEAMTAALALASEGQLIVVGDHRQMPPIIKHNWTSEPRRTFQEYHSYDSLFETLLALRPSVPVIRFAESFRLHADMAEFLRREVYAQDGIAYHSTRHDMVPARQYADPFVASVLAPEHPIIAILHDEAASMVRNRFEQELITPVLEALADPRGLNLGPKHGLGVVVPHRAQRAALREEVPCLSQLDSRTGAVAISAVDTVERFQGDEREVILVSATESDREYLLAAGEFLLDPRRLTVALSRAKHKMVLVASRSVFTLFSADEELFANAQLWKNLLRHTCTTKLWEGERGGHHVEVWGNGASQH